VHLSRFDALCDLVAAVLARRRRNPRRRPDGGRRDRPPAILWASPQHAQALLRGLRPSVAHNGTDLLSLPLYERRRCLQRILPVGSRVITEALSIQGRGTRSLRAHARAISRASWPNVWGSLRFAG